MTDTAASAPAPTKTYAAARPKVPPFARYKGTSAWRKNKRRVRAYADFLAASTGAGQKPGAAQA
jgi:hypothetical protein